MKTKRFLFAIAALVCALAASVTMVSCSSDDDDETEAVYTYGFESMSTTDLSEMATIENAFKTALGVSSSPFTYKGGDAAVKAACEKAAATLSSRNFTGDYTFVIYKSTGSTVYTWSN